jgi:hypothetical protein
MPRRWCGVAVVIVAATLAVTIRAQVPSAAPVDLRISADHDYLRGRIEMAARESIARLGDWLGPPATPSMVVADRAAGPNALVLALGRHGPPATMDVESGVVFGIARRWLTPAAGSFATDGVAWYLQSRIVETLYDYAFHNPGHSSDSVSFFDRRAAIAFPTLRMSRWTAGLARAERLRGAEPAWPRTARVLPREVTPEAAQVATALAALERSFGWPVVQGALAAAAPALRDSAITVPRLGELLSAAIGAEVGGLLTFYQQGPLDYSIASVETRPCEAGSCVRTTVMVHSEGRAAPLPLTLRVEFTDGMSAEAQWDGAASREFMFESGAPYRVARLDPEQRMLIDANRLNNERHQGTNSNMPVMKWVARWTIWLQDASLAYSSLF